MSEKTVTIRHRQPLLDISASATNTPSKRKSVHLLPLEDTENARKKINFGRVDRGDVLCDPAARDHGRGTTGNARQGVHAQDNEFVESTQETVPDDPASQDTIPDPDLPSTSSDRVPEQLKTPPTEQPHHHKQARTAATTTMTTFQESAGDVHDMVSNLKCRLQLAMYKLKARKEDLSYRELVPRRLLSGKVVSLPSPSSPQPRPGRTPSNLRTPRPFKSITSDERSLPRLMQRSSSGDASINETPIRRNYPVPNQDSSDGIKLPNIREKNELGHADYTLPSITELGTLHDHP